MDPISQNQFASFKIPFLRFFVLVFGQVNSIKLNEKWSRRVRRGFIKEKPELKKMRRKNIARHKILDTMHPVILR